MKTIFVVDDETVNLQMAEDALSEQYDVVTLGSASIMFDFLDNVVPDLILLDIMMSDIDGFDALKMLKADKRYAKIPVIFLTGKKDAATEALGFEMGVIDFVTKPFSAPVLRNRIKTHLHVEDIINKRTQKLIRLYNSMAAVLAKMVENRDKLTGKHTERTAGYVKILLNGLCARGLYAEEMNDWELESIVSAARLHDVGKITVTDLILNKTETLTKDEFEIIKTHTTEGEKIIEDIIDTAGDDDFLQTAKKIVGSHHERWDGTGYPRGLCGTEIPLQGRIMAIADVYDALVSDRPYKRAFTHEKAVEIILESRGSQFDPQLVDVFIEVSGLFTEIQL